VLLLLSVICMPFSRSFAIYFASQRKHHEVFTKNNLSGFYAYRCHF
jgi:hypothetical protein